MARTRVTGGQGWALSSDEKPQPAKPAGQSPAPKIRLEKRSGKTVIVIAGLHTYGAVRLEAMARELKTACGTGGTVKNGTIEIQGDKLDQVKAWFRKDRS